MSRIRQAAPIGLFWADCWEWKPREISARGCGGFGYSAEGNVLCGTLLACLEDTIHGIGSLFIFPFGIRLITPPDIVTIESGIVTSPGALKDGATLRVNTGNGSLGLVGLFEKNGTGPAHSSAGLSDGFFDKCLMDP